MKKSGILIGILGVIYSFTILCQSPGTPVGGPDVGGANIPNCNACCILEATKSQLPEWCKNCDLKTLCKDRVNCEACKKVLCCGKRGDPKEQCPLLAPIGCEKCHIKCEDDKIVPVCKIDSDCIDKKWVCPQIAPPLCKEGEHCPKPPQLVPVCENGKCVCKSKENSHTVCKTDRDCAKNPCPLYCAPQPDGRCISPKPACENGKCTCKIKTKPHCKIDNDCICEPKTICTSIRCFQIKSIPKCKNGRCFCKKAKRIRIIDKRKKLTLVRNKSISFYSICDNFYT